MVDSPAEFWLAVGMLYLMGAVVSLCALTEAEKEGGPAFTVAVLLWPVTFAWWFVYSVLPYLLRGLRRLPRFLDCRPKRLDR